MTYDQIRIEDRVARRRSMRACSTGTSSSPGSCPTPAIRAMLLAAEILEDLARGGISTRVFDSGLGLSIFRDKSTRTRYAFRSGCNLLGLDDRGARRVDVADRARRDGARDGDDDRLPHRGRRHPRRHVPRRGTHVHARRSRRRSTRATAAGVLLQRAGRRQPAVATSITRRRAWPTCATWRRTSAASSAAGQEAGDDLGLLAQLRQAAVGAAGDHRPDDPLRDGRRAGAPAGLRPRRQRPLRAGAVLRGRRAADRFTVVNSMAEAFEGADIVYPKSWAPMSVMQRAHATAAGGRHAGAGRRSSGRRWPTTRASRTGNAPRR